MKKILLLLVMFAIFYFSNTPNLRVLDPTTWVNNPKYEETVTDLNFIKTDESSFYSLYNLEDIFYIDFILHKLGHIFFYGLLTLLVYLNLPFKKFKYIVTWSFVTLFAFSDEVHQYFVVGRSGRILDTILDSFTSIFVLFLIFFFNFSTYILTKYRRKKLLKNRA